MHSFSFQSRELMKNWEQFNLIFHTARGWSSSDIWVNDQELAYSEYSKFFYGLQDMQNCYKAMPKYKPLKECHNSDWDCHWLELPHLHPKGGAGFYWYHCGKFRDGKYVIDKEQIRGLIEQQIKSKGLDFCPLFDRAYVHKVADLLPDFIELKENSEYEKKFVGAKIMHAPTGIRNSELQWMDGL